MIKKIIIINFFLIFSCLLVSAEIYNDISVNGNKRISKESIIVFGKIDLKKDLNQDDINKILKNLYDSKFFKKINISTKDKMLLIDLIENPIIESIVIEGIENEELKKNLLSSMTLNNRNSFIESIFKTDLNKVKNILKVNGYYFSKVKTSYTKNEELSTIRILYDIDLGKTAKIKEIQFIGDKKIKDRRLRNVITSEIDQFWKFLSRKVYLDEQRINLDERLLKNYYKNNGYYNVKINNSFAELKDNNTFKLIFNIEAGDKFKFNKLSLNLPDDFEPIHFKLINELLTSTEGQVYSLNKVNKILKEIDKIALQKQYEFINADMTETIIENNKVDILISMNESEKFYVEKINISGNNLTLEEVIRNSLIVDEGDPYNEILFNKSINNMKSKNLFRTVTSKINDGSNDNLKIIDIQVEEKPTGEISLGAGIGTSGGSIGGGIKENNFLGKGITVDTNLSVSENTVKGQFSLIKPNYNYSDNTLFTSVRSETTDNLSDSGYKTSDIGFSLATQFEQYQNFYFKPEIDIAFQNLETTSSASSNLKKQKGNYFDMYFNYGLIYDQRNRRYQPTEGFKTTFNQEIPVVSNTYEIIHGINSTRYQTLPFDMIGRVNLFAKAVNSLSDKDVRISKRVFMPASKLRGFEAGKIGPKDNDDFIGGNYVTAVNLSASLPQLLPSWEAADFSLFVDAGNLWGVDYDDSIDDNSKIRSATGITLDLLSPVGPMNFTLSRPISKATGDKTEAFRFNIGTTF